MFTIIITIFANKIPWSVESDPKPKRNPKFSVINLPTAPESFNNVPIDNNEINCGIAIVKINTVLHNFFNLIPSLL